MESTTLLIKQLKNAKLTTPSGHIISYQLGDDFRWDPKRLCITYHLNSPDDQALLLHELGHATLGHYTYDRDIQLLQMERAAWDAAVTLGERFMVIIDNDLVDSHLDSYRDWLHARSLCPRCSATGMQIAPRTYQCLSCSSQWRVNEARTCGLKRHTITK